MGAIVSLEDAKEHLRRDGDADDTRITKIISRAEEYLLDYIGFDSMEEFYYEFGEMQHWQLEAATLIVVENMYDRSSDESLTSAAKSLVRRFRSPRIA